MPLKLTIYTGVWSSGKTTKVKEIPDALNVHKVYECMSVPKALMDKWGTEFHMVTPDTIKWHDARTKHADQLWMDYLVEKISEMNLDTYETHEVIVDFMPLAGTFYNMALFGVGLHESIDKIWTKEFIDKQDKTLRARLPITSIEYIYAGPYISSRREGRPELEEDMNVIKRIDAFAKVICAYN